MKLQSKGARTAGLVIIGLLILGLIGFGTDNFGGSVRTVASVGDREITSEAYGRALQAELRRAQEAAGAPLTMAEMRAAGRDQAVLGQLLTLAAIDGEAAALGLSVGDARVHDALVAQPGFQGLDGAFDAEGYRFALERAGLSEAEYEAELRDEAARQVLIAAVAGGVEAPEAYSAAVLGFIGETRDVTWAALTPAALDAPVPDPSAEELAAWYGENGEAFTVPETRAITYLALRPEAMVDEVEVDAEAVRALYDARVADYVRPERRLVERLVFPDEEAARAAAERIEAGASDFDAEVEARGLELSDVDLGDVARDDLGGAGEGVFGLAEPGVVGPLPTDLGPALFRVNAILAASEISFEEVEEELRREVALEVAARAVDDRATELDDLLAGGATLEEAAAETGAEIGAIRLAPGSDEGIAADPAFREASETASADDFPEIRALDGGGLFALRLDEVVPPRVPPLDEVREEAVEAWRAAAARERLAAMAEELREAFAAGEDVAAEGVTIRAEDGLTRDAAVEGAPDGLVEAAFAAEPGATAVVEGDPVALLRVDEVAPPDPEGPRNALVLAALRAQASQGIAEDLLSAYVRSLQAEAGIGLNQSALAAAQARFQ